MEYLKLYSLKNNVSQNESEVFDKLIVPFLMTVSTNIQGNKVRTSKGIKFEQYESIINKHEHYQRTPYNKMVIFTPNKIKYI